MAKLKPAGIFDHVIGFFLPKSLQVHVRTEKLENGQVQVSPVFKLDGFVVPPEQVGPDAEQSIMGYRVRLDKRVLQIQRKLSSRPILSKRAAGQFLESIQKLGIAVCDRHDRPLPDKSPVMPDVTLELQADDSLKVQSELLTTEGVVLPKPSTLSNLQEDDGWYAIGDDLRKVDLTGTSLDRVLIEEGGNGTLVGDDVPRFIKLASENRSSFVGLEKNDRLSPLTVVGGTGQNVARIDGNGETIAVSPSLIVNTTDGRKIEPTADDLAALKERKRRFHRLDTGWLEVFSSVLDDHQRACDDLAANVGGLNELRGVEIPKALVALQQAAQRGPGARTPWTVYVSQAVHNAHRVVTSPANVEFKLNIVESDGRSLLELDPIYNHDRFTLNHTQVQEARDENQGWVRRRNAWIQVDADKHRKIDVAIADLDLSKSENGYTFPASRREQVLEVFSLLGTVLHSEAYVDFLAKLNDFERIEDVPLPAALRSEIQFRPYQKHGYNWLAFLHRYGLNGILADDMGLGKTLQTLAAIYRARELGQSGMPSLIICPTSVVSNWKAEAFKFFGESSVISYVGANRASKLTHLSRSTAKGHGSLAPSLVITSFDIARRDVHDLNILNWLYVVVDEGHNIKNPDAKRSKAIKTINGQHKLALTGTPIQNNLEELWSLFDFAMPAYLGSRKGFRDRYGKGSSIDWEAVRGGDRPLRERIHPFILRRLKIDVAKDLPEKVIIDQLVELSPRQVALYKEVSESADFQKMVDAVTEKGVDRAKFQILPMLTKLRVICNHPALVDHEDSANVVIADSGKLECLKELIEEIVDGEHRALLFSQSTQMLDIIEDCLKKWNVTLLRLDGGVAQHRRQQLCQDFNENAEIKCFLISTKAGREGLNLVGADTVIFYDHDWNPANDLQAQDRAYRIGQTKNVTVYRLICKGTIEEKIIARQAVKQSLADELIGSDEEGFKALTKEELLALFTLDLSDYE